MGFLLIVLGIFAIPLAFASVNPGQVSVSPWLRRTLFLALGAILIVIGIVFRMHRFR